MQRNQSFSIYQKDLNLLPVGLMVILLPCNADELAALVSMQPMQNGYLVPSTSTTPPTGDGGIPPPIYTELREPPSAPAITPFTMLPTSPTPGPGPSPLPFVVAAANASASVVDEGIGLAVR